MKIVHKIAYKILRKIVQSINSLVPLLPETSPMYGTYQRGAQLIIDREPRYEKEVPD